MGFWRRACCVFLGMLAGSTGQLSGFREEQQALGRLLLIVTVDVGVPFDRRKPV